jgi:hypothetical protein
MDVVGTLDPEDCDLGAWAAVEHMAYEVVMGAKVTHKRRKSPEKVDDWDWPAVRAGASPAGEVG